MDITKTKSKISTSKLINGETINFSFIYFIGFVLYLAIKQIMKTLIGIEANIASPVAFSLVLLGSFFAEKKFVFNNRINSGLIKQVIAFIFRCAVDFGFFSILNFALVDMLKFSYIVPYLLSFPLIFFFNYYFDRLIVFDNDSTPSNKKNGRIYKIFFSNRYVVVSIGVTSLGILFVYLLYKLFPFGDMTVLRMDLYHQYGPLFVELYERVTHFQSFIYSWNSGGGSSFIGNFFNYLSSPITSIIFLFDKDQIGYAISTLVIVKGALSAGTFTYFIKKSFNRHSFASAAFGVFYALSGYFLAYYWNIMWIDGMILLPIISLGIQRIINEGKCKTYIISLVLLLYSSYYMGYMACIFSVLYFFVYYFANNELDSHISLKNRQPRIKSKFIISCFKFGISSILVGAVCAIFLIPVYFILQSCSATTDNFPSNFTSYFDIFNLLGQHLAGLETTIRSSGDDVLPNIYCGILAVLLVPLYLANSKIRLREKVSYTLLVIFFIFSFDNNVMNFIWNAFHMPNDLPYRFSYMYVFIILIMAFRGLMHINSIKYKDIMFTGIVALILVLIIQKMPTNKISEFSIYVSLAFVMIWTLVLLLIKKGKMSKFVIGITIICMTFSEVIVADSNSYVFTQNQHNYNQYLETYENALDYIEENDDSFYRTELTHLQTRLDPSIYNYNGMSTFSSMAYENYSGTQYSLGMYGNRINSFTYNTQTPVYNMMYGIKYLIKNENSITPSAYYYKNIYTTDDTKQTEVYENRYALPVAFTVPESITDWNNAEGNPFEVQESLIDNAAGVSNIFVPSKYISTQSTTAYCDNIDENGVYTIQSKSGSYSGGTVDIMVESVKNSNMYVYITSSDFDSVDYYWDQGESTDHQSISTPYIMDLGYFEENDQLKISLDLTKMTNGSGTFTIYVYNVDNDVLNSAYDMLSLGKMNITSYSNTSIEGNVNCGYDGYIYTSIPYDKGWDVYVDGNKVEAESLGDCQLIIPVEAGEHSIKMTYKPRGIIIGAIITGGSIVLLAGYEILKKKKIIDKIIYKQRK